METRELLGGTKENGALSKEGSLICPLSKLMIFPFKKQSEKMSYWLFLGGSRMVMVQYIQTVAPMTQRLVHMLYTEKSCWTPGMVD